MKYQIEISSRFKKDYKLAQKRGYNMNLLKEVIDILANGEQLPEKYLDYPLVIFHNIANSALMYLRHRENGAFSLQNKS